MMKKRDVKSYTNVFKSAVDNTVELKDGYCRGLQALKGNSLKVSVSKQQNLSGSGYSRNHQKYHKVFCYSP